MLFAEASLYGQVTCADVPNYSAQLRIAGVCNATDTLAAYGTFLGEAYRRGGGANERPAGVQAGDLALTPPSAGADGELFATIRRDADARLRADRHLASILLVDAATGAPVTLDYLQLTEQVLDAGGQIAGARLRLPAGTALPERLRADVIVDAFPLAVRDL